MSSKLSSKMRRSIWERTLDQRGFSIMEALVGIVLLGLVVIFSVIIFNNVWVNPSLAFKSEAFLLANQEIENSINKKAAKDTTYNNFKNNLLVLRSVETKEDFNFVTVSVTHSPTGKEIVLLSVMMQK